MAKVGHDIELAVRIRGDLVPACALPEDILGDKGKALDIGDGVGVLVDGVSIEINQDPFDNPSALMKGVIMGIKKARTHLKKTLKIDDIDLLLGGSFMYSKDNLEGFPKAFESGCDPDYNAYTMEKNERHTFIDNRRYFAGHIHVSYDNVDEVPAHMAITLLEAFAYPFLMKLDKQEHRRETFGKAGCYRPKPYGAEWRMPSNLWAKNNDNTLEFLKAVFKVVNFIEKEPDIAIKTYLSIPKVALQNAIDLRNYAELYKIGNSITRQGLGIRDLYPPKPKNTKKQHAYSFAMPQELTGLRRGRIRGGFR